MSSRGDATLPATRRSRKSLGVHGSSRKAADKENATIDMGTSLAANRKKSRSKSLGPGGLDALKQGAGNRRASLAPPRSILKPTAPLLPEIPPHKSKTGAGTSRADTTANPLGDGGQGEKVALRTEEEQQAAAREREEWERRDARRKSLANRRVSFAEQATLHTFHEIEYMQDSTSSTDSTRRASSITAPSPAPSNSQPSGVSTPQEQIDDPVAEIEDNQRELHQKKRRRSSGVQRMSYDQDDDTLASTVYSSDSEPADVVEEVVEDDSDSDSSTSDSDDDGTMMTIEAEEMTSASVASGADESSTVDEALRLASARAGAQRHGDDETGEEEVIPSFGWVKKGPASQHASGSGEETTMEMDMDITRAAGGIIKAKGEPDADDQSLEMSMDVTKSYGGIISKNSGNLRAPPVDDEDRSLREESMDLTSAVGGVLRPNTAGDDDEDMSMELTTAIGGVLGNKKSGPQTRRRTVGQADRTMNIEMTMDMTVGAGRILSHAPISEDAGGDQTMAMDMTVPVGKVLRSGTQGNAMDDDDATVGMDMTTALGGIIKKQPKNRAEAKRIMEEEVDKPDSPPKTKLASKSPKRRLSVVAVPSNTNENGSPGLSAFRGTGLRRSTAQAAIPDSPPKPVVTTPTKPTTALGQTSSATKKTSTSTPSKISKSPRRAGRPKSPQRQTPEPKRTQDAAQDAPARANALFSQDPKTGSRTPTVILTPRSRRLSGLGADRSGLGSPRVAAILDRRVSIGDSAESFTPVQLIGKRVAFDDPRAMESELDKQLKEEQDKENRRRILERETNGDDATLTLKEMISSLSPKKNARTARKSLHVGSARGVLGKRPAELDDDEEEEEMDGVKRLKGHQSPVKNVRMTRAAHKSMEQTRSNATPSTSGTPGKTATTPKGQGRFKNVKDDRVSHGVDFEGHPAHDDDDDMDVDDEEDADGRIHLQDFLNMTSIRFMELTTSKRRQTQMPVILRDGEDDMSLERCVAAAACTVPMLSLYQHSCREIKKYMSEGQRDVKKVEIETYEDNPPLFKEYMSATPDIKALMDNQFKNVKTHARLLSKAMWYEWRMKLQEGLKGGLVEIRDGMDEDEAALRKQQELLDSVLPELIARHESLSKEHSNLEMYARELADCDPEELDNARRELVSVESDVEAKKQEVARLRQELEEAESAISQATAQKQQCLDDIKESEKIREECRGWSATEINFYKERVQALEKQHGWAVTGVSGGTQISMTYKRDIEIVFDVASFQRSSPQNAAPQQGNTRIDLWYIGANRKRNPQPATPEKEFFLQCIRDVVRSLPQSRTEVVDMLRLVRAAWDMAGDVEQKIRLVNIAFPTTVKKTGDESIAVVSTLLIRDLKTKVEATLNLRARPSVDGVDVGIVPETRVVYGEGFNAGKMTEFLKGRIGERVGEKEEGWADILLDLHAKLLARGRKDHE